VKRGGHYTKEKKGVGGGDEGGSQARLDGGDIDRTPNAMAWKVEERLRTEHTRAQRCGRRVLFRTPAKDDRDISPRLRGRGVAECIGEGGFRESLSGGFISGNKGCQSTRNKTPKEGAPVYPALAGFTHHLPLPGHGNYFCGEHEIQHSNQ